MRCKTTAVMALLISAVLAFNGCSGCNPTQECGTWVFTGTPSGNSFPMNNAFTFDPASCGKSCQCSKDPIIQMVWVYDEVNGTNLYASDQPQGTRSAADGWGIDQINGWAYAYYSLQNDGTFSATYGLPGANGTASQLNDDPSGWGPNIYFHAVDVPVCYASDTCKNKILGYYYWSYYTDSSDVGHKLIIGVGWQDLESEFQNAVSAWNAWAPTSGSENDGTATLPNAVALPALSDL